MGAFRRHFGRVWFAQKQVLTLSGVIFDQMGAFRRHFGRVWFAQLQVLTLSGVIFDQMGAGVISDAFGPPKNKF